jgi:hypothetical protein
MNPVLVVGSVALDTVETPGARRDSVLGGSATFFALSARRFAPVRLKSASSGRTFPEHRDLPRPAARRLEGLQVAPPHVPLARTIRRGAGRRDTVSVDLEILLDLFPPELPESYRDSRFVLLRHWPESPGDQKLAQLRDPKFVLRLDERLDPDGARGPDGAPPR